MSHEDMLSQTGTLVRAVKTGSVVKGADEVADATLSTAVKHFLTVLTVPKELRFEKEVVTTLKGCHFLAGEDVKHGDKFTAGDGNAYRVLEPATVPDGDGSAHHIEAMLLLVT